MTDYNLFNPTEVDPKEIMDSDVGKEKKITQSLRCNVMRQQYLMLEIYK